MNQVARILSAGEHGDPGASAKLLPLVDDELRKLAARQLAHKKPGQPLEAGALVRDANLRMVGADDDPRRDHRGHFFAAAAEAGRRIVVENSCRKRSAKHGGGRVRRGLDHIELATPELRDDLEALVDALNRLAEKGPVKADLVKFRYFARPTIEGAAPALGISMTTANRHWAHARAWLHQEITSGDPARKNRPPHPEEQNIERNDPGRLFELNSDGRWSAADLSLTGPHDDRRNSIRRRAGS
jgi:RNA polymerase sigma factor (TIGR02999 family)